MPLHILSEWRAMVAGGRPGSWKAAAVENPGPMDAVPDNKHKCNHCYGRMCNRLIRIATLCSPRFAVLKSDSLVPNCKQVATKC
jgi:hypothetical protein